MKGCGGCLLLALLAGGGLLAGGIIGLIIGLLVFIALAVLTR